MGYLWTILLGYFLGCSNMAVYIAKLKKVDLRSSGSGNPGTSNAVILMGWKIGILVGLHDIGKAYLALNWKFALIVMVVVALITLVTDYLVLGTFTTILAVPVYMGIATKSLLAVLILCVGTAVIFYKHRENMVRLYKGTEIGLRSTARGDHRVKQ